MPTLRDVLQRQRAPHTGPVLFKSCGWAGWDLAAARLAVRRGTGLGADRGAEAHAPREQVGA